MMVLRPIASGILDETQFEPVIEDPSDAPVLVLQVTDGEPVPPVTVPVSEIVEAVVVAGGTSTVRARALGGGTDPVCAAYKVRMAALSPSARPVTILR